MSGAAWKALTAEDKVQYEKKAEIDKERYATEMKDYTPPPAEYSTKKAKGKAKKDPNA